MNIGYEVNFAIKLVFLVFFSLTLFVSIVSTFVIFLRTETYNHFKGFKKVNKELRKIKLSDGRIYKKLVFYEENSKSFLVDFLVIRSDKVFLLNVYNLCGTVLGKESDYKWCQVIRKRKFYFVNPLSEMKEYKEKLMSLLKLKETEIDSFPVLTKENLETFVPGILYLEDLPKILLEEKSVTSLEIEEVISGLKKQSKNSYKARHKHFVSTNKTI